MRAETEVLNGIRGLWLGQKLADVRARQAIDDFLDLPIHRHPVESLASEIWKLRHNFNVYDGAYVVLAQALGITLITLDRKIAHSAPAHIDVQVYPSSP